jgi:enoyl-[acyl-carrier-protein] reductase (NADH)
VDAREVAEAVLALASGMLDGFSGQVLTVDRGMTFFDNLMRLYHEREALGL